MQGLILMALAAFALSRSRKKKPTLAERAGSSAKLQAIQEQTDADRAALVKKEGE